MTRRLALAALLLASCRFAHADEARARFTWNGAVAVGRTIYLRNLNGPIRAVAGTGREVRLTATKTARDGGDPDAVEIAVVPHDGTVTICALWPRAGRSCGPRGAYAPGSGTSGRPEVTVELVVEVPRGVAVDLATVNGGIDADGLDAAVVARSRNGGLAVTTRGAVDLATQNGGITLGGAGGQVRAVTDNGGVRADLVGVPAGARIELTTTNGSVRVRVPRGFAADVTASTTHGSIDVAGARPRGRRGGVRLDTRLGAGGRALVLRTVNGAIALDVDR
jgi:hypothetical protein